MTRYVADTHALYWHLIRSPKLGPGAAEVFRAGSRGEAEIAIPAIVMAELYYLNNKHGNALAFATVVDQLTSSRQYSFPALYVEDVLDFETDRTVSEMHDRIIVGVARRLGAACLTADHEIHASGLVEVVWA